MSIDPERLFRSFLFIIRPRFCIFPRAAIVQKKITPRPRNLHLSVLSYDKKLTVRKKGDSALKPLSFVKTILTRACVIYTVLITGVYMTGAFVNSAWLPSPSTVAALLVLSLWLGASISFLFSDLLVPSLRVILHFITTGLVFFLTFGVWGGYLKNGGSAAVLFVLYAVLYALAGGITGLVRILSAGRENREKPYGSMIKEKDGGYRSQFSPADEKGKR